MRCEGGYPSCVNCNKIGEKCRYSEQDSTITRLQNALNRSEQQAEKLRQELQSLLVLDPEKCQSSLRTIVERNTHQQTEDVSEGAERHATTSREPTYNSAQTGLRGSDDALDDGRDEEV